MQFQLDSTQNMYDESGSFCTQLQIDNIFFYWDYNAADLLIKLQDIQTKLCSD